MLSRTTSIPTQLNSAFFKAENSEIEKSVLMFLALKSLEFRRSGYIHNYTSRLQEIAKSINCSESTLRRRVAELKRIGLVKAHNKKHLSLRSYARLCELYNIKDTRRYYLPLDTFLEKPRFILEAMALAKTIAQQQYKINAKINGAINKDQRRNNKTRRIIQSRLNQFHSRNGISLIEAIEQLNLNLRTKESFDSYIDQQQLSSINSKTALSCIGMAKLINRRSGITGSKRLRKMASMHLITREHRYKVLYYGNEAKQALMHYRGECSFYVFKYGNYILSPIACGVAMVSSMPSSKVNTFFDRKQ